MDVQEGGSAPQLQDRINELNGKLSDLMQKFENNEKFWKDKCNQQTDDMNELVLENRENVQKIKSQQKEIEYLNEQLRDLKQDKNAYADKNNQKEQIVETLQTRLTDLI